MAESSAQPQVNMRRRWACNIRLQEARDPVLSTCGHLFCWPCLYPWVHDLGKPCPVCRAPITEDTNIIAVYGSTGAGSSVAGSSSIPPRPLPVVRPLPPPPRRLIRYTMEPPTFRFHATVDGVETEQAQRRQRSAREDALHILNPLARDDRNLFRMILAMRNAARSATQTPPPSPSSE